jgi:DNA-binding XRE family transcriptional regulator
VAVDVQLDLADDVVADYLAGRATLEQLAARVGMSAFALGQTLRARGVETLKGAYQRRRRAGEIERTNGLPRGTGLAAVAGLYAERLSCRAIAEQLGVEWQATRRLLHDEHVAVRPNWWREVFHGRHGDRAAFAERLRALREARGWSRLGLARRCRLSRTTIASLEVNRKGPSWDTLARLARAFGLGVADFGVTWSPP